MQKSSTARSGAEHFLKNEREFHLGALPTEQSHPKTARFSEIASADVCAGIRLLQSVDDDILPMAERVFAGDQFEQLVAALTEALKRRKRICFSGCGATGRLSILLEAAWRGFWRRLKLEKPEIAAQLPDGEDQVISIMTGGDYALIRSVESFEDYMSFGRQQVREAGLQAGDVLVAITEGGETSSVIGTVWQALETGAACFFVCNNPLDVLEKHVERSRAVIREPRVTKLDISSGPMAIAGSTRMQATTAELLVAGAALELALSRHVRSFLTGPLAAQIDTAGRNGGAYAGQFAETLKAMAEPAAVRALGRLTLWEEGVYAKRGAVTYFADRYLLDIFTDTTERAPTFMLPPFRKDDDRLAPRSLAFVKSLLKLTPEAWRRMLGRDLRCLDWTSALYRELGASEKICAAPPLLNRNEVMKFTIGSEDDPSRYSEKDDAALLVVAASELAARERLAEAFQRLAARFPRKSALVFGAKAVGLDPAPEIIFVPWRAPSSPLDLWNHLAVKLVFNTVSTTTMARMGRVTGNWMAHVETTNKKLIDRGTRLVAELAGVSYAQACCALFETREELAGRPDTGKPKPSPVALTIERLAARAGRL